MKWREAFSYSGECRQTSKEDEVTSPRSSTPSCWCRRGRARHLVELIVAFEPWCWRRSCEEYNTTTVPGEPESRLTLTSRGNLLPNPINLDTIHAHGCKKLEQSRCKRRPKTSERKAMVGICCCEPANEGMDPALPVFERHHSALSGR
jgi:hypothetical protein